MASRLLRLQPGRRRLFHVKRTSSDAAGELAREAYFGPLVARPVLHVIRGSHKRRTQLRGSHV